jgi:hypothetical protein
MIKLANILKEILLTELNKQQLDSIAKALGTERTSEFDSKLNSLNAKGMTYPDILKQVKDGISQGKSPEEIFSSLSSTVGKSAKDLESDFETIVDNENIIIQVPHTHAASRKLGLSTYAYRECKGGGKDSAWCTTHGSPEYFKDYYYSDNKTLYYIKVKSPEIIQQLQTLGLKSLVVSAVVVNDKNKINSVFNGKDEAIPTHLYTHYLEKVLGLNKSMFISRRSKEERSLAFSSSQLEAIKYYIKNGSKGPLEIVKLDSELPSDLTLVGGDLKLIASKITKLPDNLVVKGKLIISQCPNITTIPEGIKYRSLALFMCPAITSIAKPKNKIEDLTIDDCPSFTELPKGIKAQYIRIQQCPQFFKLPDNLTSSTVDIRSLKVSEMPNNLKVYRFLLANTPLAKKYEYDGEQIIKAIQDKGGEMVNFSSFKLNIVM